MLLFLRMALINKYIRHSLPNYHEHQEIVNDDTSGNYRLYNVTRCTYGDVARLCNNEDIFSYSVAINSVKQSTLLDVHHHHSLEHICERYMYELTREGRVYGLDNVNKISSLLLAVSKSEYVLRKLREQPKRLVCVFEPHSRINTGQSLMVAIEYKYDY